MLGLDFLFVEFITAISSFFVKFWGFKKNEFSQFGIIKMVKI